MKQTGTLYKTDGTKSEISWNSKNCLDVLQKAVGGYIQVVNINGNDLVINEEGFLHDLAINTFSRKVGKESIWQDEDFFGDIVLVNGVLN